MSEKINANALFMNAVYGFNTTYQQLMGSNSQGITLDNLNSTTNVNYSTMPFLNYMKTNFKDLDTDNNSTISPTEIQKLMNDFQMNGLSYAQLMQLSSSGAMGADTTSLSQVLQNFQKIDRNSDGKISLAEINAYNTSTEIAEKKDKLKEIKKNDISLFYSDDDSTSVESTSETTSSNTDDTDKVGV